MLWNGQPQLRLTIDTASPMPDDVAMLKRLKQAWKREPLTVAALGSVGLGFLMWAAPLELSGVGLTSENLPCRGGAYEQIGDLSLLLVRVYFGCDRLDFYWADYWFQFDRLPAVLFFFTLAAFLYWYGNRATIVGNIRGR
jgi:hypothetical protein